MPHFNFLPLVEALVLLFCSSSLSSSRLSETAMIGGKQLQKLVGGLKSKLMRPLKWKKAYDKMGKTESVRVEIKSKKTQKLIAETLKIADSLGRRNNSF